MTGGCSFDQMLKHSGLIVREVKTKMNSSSIGEIYSLKVNSERGKIFYAREDK